MSEVSSAIRMLGSFFQDYTGARRDKGTKTCDHSAFTAGEEPEVKGETFFTQDDALEDDLLETMAAENDEDAIVVLQFEDSISETIQNDPDLSAYYGTRTRRREDVSMSV
eukprot:s154_g12.t1